MSGSSFSAEVAERALAEQVLAELQSILDERRMTRADLAEAMGVSPAMVSGMFSGAARGLTIGVVARAMHALRVQPVIRCRTAGPAGPEGLEEGAEASQGPGSGWPNAHILRPAGSEKWSSDPGQDESELDLSDAASSFGLFTNKYKLGAEAEPDSLAAGLDNGSGGGAQITWDDLRDFARLNSSIRVLRTTFVGPDLSRGPLWDILVLCLLAHLEGKSISVDYLRKVLRVPATTASRHIGVLLDHELIARSSGIRNAKTRHITITDAGIAIFVRLLSGLFKGAARAQPQDTQSGIWADLAPGSDERDPSADGPCSAILLA